MKRKKKYQWICIETFEYWSFNNVLAWNEKDKERKKKRRRYYFLKRRNNGTILYSHLPLGIFFIFSWYSFLYSSFDPFCLYCGCDEKNIASSCRAWGATRLCCLRGECACCDDGAEWGQKMHQKPWSHRCPCLDPRRCFHGMQGASSCCHRYCSQRRRRPLASATQCTSSTLIRCCYTLLYSLLQWTIEGWR